jgi:hypothetical protein
MYGVVAYTGRHGLSPYTHIGRSREIFRAFGGLRVFPHTFADSARLALDKMRGGGPPFSF